MHVLLFANGIITPGTALQNLLDSTGARQVVCADGGALHARALGYRPDVIIGDLDSLSQAQVREFEGLGARILQHPREKDETDLELALAYCVEVGATRIHIVGGLGGRFDQTLANVFLLAQSELEGVHIEIVDGEQVIRLLRPGAHAIRGETGDTISLIPLRAAAHGIVTSGLQYPLRGESLGFGPARGLSNALLAPRAELAFTEGLLLLVHTRGQA